MNYSDLVWKERTCGLFKKRHYLEAVAFTDNGKWALQIKKELNGNIQ